MTLYWKVAASLVVGSWLVGVLGLLPVEWWWSKGEEWLKGFLSVGFYVGAILGLFGVLLMLW